MIGIFVCDRYGGMCATGRKRRVCAVAVVPCSCMAEAKPVGVGIVWWICIWQQSWKGCLGGGAQVVHHRANMNSETMFDGIHDKYEFICEQVGVGQPRVSCEWCAYESASGSAQCLVVIINPR